MSTHTSQEEVTVQEPIFASLSGIFLVLWLLLLIGNVLLIFNSTVRTAFYNTLAPKGSVHITLQGIPNTTPTVYLDMELVGTLRADTPLVVDNVLLGNHIITLKADGYTPAYEEVTLEQGETTYLVSLESLPQSKLPTETFAIRELQQ